MGDRRASHGHQQVLVRIVGGALWAIIYVTGCMGVELGFNKLLKRAGVGTIMDFGRDLKRVLINRSVDSFEFVLNTTSSRNQYHSFL